MLSPPSSNPDDTFEFKKGKRKSVPGGFDDDDGLFYEDDNNMMSGALNTSQQSFLGEGSAGSHLGDSTQQAATPEESGLDSDADVEMTSSSQAPNRTAELEQMDNRQSFVNSVPPKSILKASQRFGSGTPAKGSLIIGADWTENLLRTVSPKKRDRHALRESQGAILKAMDYDADSMRQSTHASGKKFSNTMDIMDSLFDNSGGQQSGKQKASTKAFEV